MFDFLTLVIIAVFVVAAIAVLATFSTGAPKVAAVADVAAAIPERRGLSNPKQRKATAVVEAKKKEQFVWDKDNRKGVKETDKYFNVIKAGEKMVTKARKETKIEETEVSQRQKNRLQSQGFVVVEDKAQAPVKKVVEDEGEKDPYKGMDAAAKARLEVLDEILGGRKRDGEYRGKKKDDKKKEETTEAAEETTEEKPAEVKASPKKNSEMDNIRRKLQEEKKKVQDEKNAKSKIGFKVNTFSSGTQKAAPWVNAAREQAAALAEES